MWLPLRAQALRLDVGPRISDRTEPLGGARRTLGWRTLPKPSTSTSAPSNKPVLRRRLESTAVADQRPVHRGRRDVDDAREPGGAQLAGVAPGGRGDLAAELTGHDMSDADDPGDGPRPYHGCGMT